MSSGGRQEGAAPAAEEAWSTWLVAVLGAVAVAAALLALAYWLWRHCAAARRAAAVEVGSPGRRAAGESPPGSKQVEAEAGGRVVDEGDAMLCQPPTPPPHDHPYENMVSPQPDHPFENLVEVPEYTNMRQVPPWLQLVGTRARRSLQVPVPPPLPVHSRRPGAVEASNPAPQGRILAGRQSHRMDVMPGPGGSTHGPERELSAAATSTHPLPLERTSTASRPPVSPERTAKHSKSAVSLERTFRDSRSLVSLEQTSRGSRPPVSLERMSRESRPPVSLERTSMGSKPPVGLSLRNRGSPAAASLPQYDLQQRAEHMSAEQRGALLLPPGGESWSEASREEPEYVEVSARPTGLVRPLRRAMPEPAPTPHWGKPPETPVADSRLAVWGKPPQTPEAVAGAADSMQRRRSPGGAGAAPPSTSAGRGKPPRPLPRTSVSRAANTASTQLTQDSHSTQPARSLAESSEPLLADRSRRPSE